ncbi:MAG: type II secretion system protein [Acidimicrobiales bacterium]
MTLVHKLKERRRAAGQEGFTLIELLVVIIILGILAAVVVFAVGGVGDKGNEASCVIDTRTLRTAAEAHFAQNGDYTVEPGDANGITTPTGTVDENALVAAGFLSEVSTMHSATVADLNPATTGIGSTTYGVTILVEDGTPPGNDCGVVGTNVSASSTDDSF